MHHRRKIIWQINNLEINTEWKLADWAFIKIW